MQWLECQLWNEAGLGLEPSYLPTVGLGLMNKPLTSSTLCLQNEDHTSTIRQVIVRLTHNICWFSIIAQEVFFFFFFFLSLDWKQRKKSAQGAERRESSESSLYFLPAHPWSLSPTSFSLNHSPRLL